MTWKEFLLALKFVAEKIVSLKWKRNQRLCGLFLLVLLHCYTVYCCGIFCTFLCPNMVKWHNSGIINAFNKKWMNKLSLSMLSEWNVVHGYAGSSYSVTRRG